MRIMVCIFFIFISLTASATDYYVTQYGSNGNSGLDTYSAWLTIDYAVDNVTAGSVVYVCSGTYAELVYPAGSGASGNQVTVQAVTEGDSNWCVVIDGGGARNQCFYLQNNDYWTVKGFVMYKAIQYAVYNHEGVSCHFENCWFLDSTTYGGFALAGSTPEPSDCIIKNCVFTGNKTIGIILDDGINCTMSNCLSYGNTTDGVYICDKASMVVTIIDSIFHDNGGYGFNYEGGGGSSITHNNNCAEGNTSGQWNNLSSGGTDVTSDPTIMDAANNNFYLSTGSPCVDAGSRTSASASLDDKYSEQGSDPDAGTVDMGFHYRYAQSAGGGGTTNIVPTVHNSNKIGIWGWF